MRQKFIYSSEHGKKYVGKNRRSTWEIKKKLVKLRLEEKKKLRKVSKDISEKKIELKIYKTRCFRRGRSYSLIYPLKNFYQRNFLRTNRRSKKQAIVKIVARRKRLGKKFKLFKFKATHKRLVRSKLKKQKILKNIFKDILKRNTIKTMTKRRIRIRKGILKMQKRALYFLNPKKKLNKKKRRKYLRNSYFHRYFYKRKKFDFSKKLKELKKKLKKYKKIKKSPKVVKLIKRLYKKIDQLQSSIKKKRRVKFLFVRTRRSESEYFVDYDAELKIFQKLKKDLVRFEARRLMETPKFYRNPYNPLSERPFRFGKVYLTHKRRNTFITVADIIDKQKRIQHNILYKSSCGFVGYIGPKRKTYYARLAVAKAASAFLPVAGLTTIDVIFQPRLLRLFRRIFRYLIRRHIYVRYLIVPKRRAHGLVRKRKRRRK